MESYPSKFGLCAVAAFGLAMIATFSACGDENTTEVNESNGLDIIAKGDTLPECGSDNAGDMVFVTDSSAVFYCADEKWSTLNGKDGEKGEKGDQGDVGATGAQGEKGETGAEGKATDGTSCTAKTVENGIEVSCGGKVVGTLKNGEPGQATDGVDGKSACALALGKDEECSADELAGWLASLKGDAGKNCSIADVNDPNDATKVIGYEITCDEDKKTVYNGTNGKPGASCTVKDNGDGKVVVTCGDDEPVTLFKAMCGSVVYDPEKESCYESVLYDKGTSIYDETTETLVDMRDLQEYKTVTVEITEKNYKKTWMAENLNFAYKEVPFSYTEGAVTFTSDSTSWCGGGRETTAGNCSVYGRLYTWAAAIDSVALANDAGKKQICGYGVSCDRLTEDALAVKPIRGVCPGGWHLPSYTEWEALLTAIGGTSIAGEILKSTSGWNNGGNGKDAIGFSAIPAGIVNETGKFSGVGDNAVFWSASQYEADDEFASRVYMDCYGKNASLSNFLKNYAYPVRCVKN